MMRFVMRAMVAVVVVVCFVGCGPRAGDRSRDDTGWGRAGCDTIFTHRYEKAGQDSGYDLVRIDAAGDSLALYLRWIVGDSPHIRVIGPFGGINRGTRTKIWNFLRMEVQSPGHYFASAEDFCTGGGNGVVVDPVMTNISNTRSSIAWRQSWRFMKDLVDRSDTLDIVRITTMECGQPYYVVHYDFTWVNERPGKLRFIWYFQRQTKLGRRRSKHDVGYAPGHGMVTRRHSFPAADLGYCAAMANIGNPLATHVDTLSDGRLSHMSPELMVDFGSGSPAFPAGFICFHPGKDIVPSEFAWIDTHGVYVPTLHCDSAEIRVDTTNVLDHEERYLYGRTEQIEFSHGQTMTMEFAVGRAWVDDHDTVLIIPDIVWPDGTTSRPGKATEE
jgi:hypothetical protein